MSARLRAAQRTLVKAARIARTEQDPVVRRGFLAALTRDDPLLFALLFLPHHLTDDEGLVSLSVVHEQWLDKARGWSARSSVSREHRDAYVAPRSMGKSTWWFLILPMWAAAHGHVRFAAAFSDSTAQAETHLSTFKHELDTNAALREAFPDLCKPAVRPRGTTVSDNRAMLQTKAGFVFAARGIDSGNLGMKVGDQRPDLLILDDVEPGESNYSAYQVEKRLGTIQDVVLPLNDKARVVLVGTVTMPGSIVHQLVQHHEDPKGWIVDENFTIHHAKPVYTDDAGGRHSIWPEKWPITYLLSIEHTRSYAKNFLNQPVATDGDYWTPDVYQRGTLDGCTMQVLSIDPAVTTKKSSDYTGIAIVAKRPEVSKVVKGKRRVITPSRVVVRKAIAVKLGGAALRAKVLTLVEEFPETTHVLVEVNQGGDLWREVLHDLPVKLLVRTSSDPKEVRAGTCLNHYERGRVLHEGTLTDLEQQQCSFPKAPNDDLVDAVGQAVNRLLGTKKTGTAGAKTVPYA